MGEKRTLAGAAETCGCKATFQQKHMTSFGVPCQILGLRRAKDVKKEGSAAISQQDEG
jgi:hypothetical protein